MELLQNRKRELYVLDSGKKMIRCLGLQNYEKLILMKVFKLYTLTKLREYFKPYRFKLNEKKHENILKDSFISYIITVDTIQGFKKYQ